MGMGWLLIAAVGVAAYVGYRKLQEIERDLRQEIAEQAQGGSGTEKSSPPEPPPAGQGTSQPRAAQPTVPAEEVPVSLQMRILDRVKVQPGLLQTELYELLADVPRRRLQTELRVMDETGILKRQRDGGSYRLDLP